MQQSKCCVLPLDDSPMFAMPEIARWIQGLEPWASRATIWRASQLRYIHHIFIQKICALRYFRQTASELTESFNVPFRKFLPKSKLFGNVSEGIRTPDTRLRRAVLYPAELLTHAFKFLLKRERVMGIEPTCLAWKASVLPLNYTRIISYVFYPKIGVTGFEPATSCSQSRRSTKLSHTPPVVSFTVRLF